MFLPKEPRCWDHSRFPRVRGDVPLLKPSLIDCPRFSPRARGCSLPVVASAYTFYVFPACAGMFRSSAAAQSTLRRFPRVRGDVPRGSLGGVLIGQFSPRARGCSSDDIELSNKILVFPACAGMFLFLRVRLQIRFCFPRVRGDVPSGGRQQAAYRQFSPRARGCSFWVFRRATWAWVFPACAGMFPTPG